MTRRLSVLLVLAFFVMSLGSLAFAAKAKTVSQSNSSAAYEATAQRMVTPLDNDVSEMSTSGKPTTTPPTSMGYYMVNPGEVSVGTTAWDWQSNDAIGRRVAIGSDGKIHTVWMYHDDQSGLSGATRSVYYNGYQANSTPAIPDGTDMSGVTGGYPAIAAAPGEALAYAAYHYTFGTGARCDPRSRTAIGKQTLPFSPIFNMISYPSSDSIMSRYLNCTNYKSGLDTLEGGYIWPQIATDVNSGGQTIVHVLTKESSTAPAVGFDTTGIASLVYYRTAVNAAGPGVCGTVIDSIKGSFKYVIVADPSSQKVAAVYCRPNPWRNDANDGYAESNEDVYYKESTDLGATWPSVRSEVLMPGKADSTIGTGGGVFWQRAEDVSALYSDDGCLHVLYLTGWNDPIGHSYIPVRSRLTHWSSCTPTHYSVVVDQNATWFSSGARPPYFKLYLSMPTLAQCKVGAATRLYAVYTLYPDSTGLAAPNNVHADASANATPILNGDVCVSGSTDITGTLWGPPVNITNTNSNGCTNAADCFSESFANAAIYSNDSLRIQYLVDKIAGYAYRNATGSTAQGEVSINPMVIKTYPCFAITPVATVTKDVDSIVWPFHTIPGGTNAVPMILTNSGNTAANYTRTLSPAAPWLSFANASPTGTVPVGWPNTLAETITATGPGTEGYYRTLVTWTYTWDGNPGASKTLTMPVELYNYSTANWFVEANNTIATSYVTMVTNQNSRVGNQKGGFKYVSDGGALADTAYIYDGGLVIGTSSATLSAGSMSDSVGAGGQGDPRIGRMFCLSNLTIDETGVTPQGYRHSSGKGCNKDSTIAFDVDFYAPKFIDSSHFMIGKFSLYSGPKNPAATINNVAVAYAADWDVPDDSSDNQGGFDAALQMVYQQGRMNTTRYGAMSGWREDNTPLAGGWILSNTHWIYRLTGFQSDTLWSLLQSTTTFGFGPGWRIDQPPLDTVADLNMMLVFSKNATITPKATGVFTVYVIYAGQPGHQAGYTGSLDNLKGQIARAKKFMCNWLSPNPALCVVGCNKCGDANSDDAIDIADAVFLITYIFKSGAAPGVCNYTNGKGDANGDLAVDIADAVYLITYIFKSGALPHCNGM